MSDILIKNMEIPKSCWDCPFHDEDVCYPGKMSIRRNHHSDRSEHCPLIEVPKHGRLIDADACAEYFEDQAQDEWNKNTGTTWSNAYLSLGAYIEEDAPTIIESEE